MWYDDSPKLSRLPLTLAAAAYAERQFYEAVEDEADPGVDNQAPVEAIWLMTCRRGKVRHEDEEVEQAANEDGGELFEEAASHGLRDSLEDSSSRR